MSERLYLAMDITDRGIQLTEEPLIKTTTNKIKRQANLDAMDKRNN